MQWNAKSKEEARVLDTEEVGYGRRKNGRDLAVSRQRALRPRAALSAYRAYPLLIGERAPRLGPVQTSRCASPRCAGTVRGAGERSSWRGKATSRGSRGWRPFGRPACDTNTPPVWFCQRDLPTGVGSNSKNCSLVGPSVFVSFDPGGQAPSTSAQVSLDGRHGLSRRTPHRRRNMHRSTVPAPFLTPLGGS
jgi:hypothetical protein